MALVARGKIGAFETLAGRYAGPIHRFFARRLGHEDRGEDLAQDTFLRLWRARERYRPGVAPFRVFLYTIATNLLRNELRRQVTERAHVRPPVGTSPESDDGDAVSQASAPEADPSMQLEQAELRERLFEAATRLPAEWQDAWHLRDVQGLAYDEIATVLEIPAGTVKSRIARARLALAEALGPYLEVREDRSDGV